jgi:hypothetical protein
MSFKELAHERAALLAQIGMAQSPFSGVADMGYDRGLCAARRTSFTSYAFAEARPCIRDRACPSAARMRRIAS